MTTLAERKEAAISLTIGSKSVSRDATDAHTRAARRVIYGRTSPRPGLCGFDAYGMDIVEGRA